MIRSFCLLLAVSIALSGCSSFSKSARQQRAYEKYVRRSSIARVKQRARFHSGKPQLPPAQMPTEPVMTAQSGPQAISAGDSQ
ncbi:MAG: hypothetical protein ACXWAV_01070 [Chthoniobacterales bacterium]